MTLEELIQKICNHAIMEKLINSVLGAFSPYELNRLTVKDYATFIICPTGNSTFDLDGRMTFSFTIYYIDRLTDDNSNDISIFSTGVEELKNIIKWLNEEEDILGVGQTSQFTNFVITEGMADKVAGTYANITVEVFENSNCFLD